MKEQILSKYPQLKVKSETTVVSDGVVDVTFVNNEATEARISGQLAWSQRDRRTIEEALEYYYTRA